MDFPAPRRKVNTYGKARKIRVPDIFDLGSETSFAPTTTREHHVPLSTHAAPATSLPKAKDDSEVKVTNTHRLARRKPFQSATASPLLTETDTSETFDIHSSPDDEPSEQGKQPALKKRKMIPVQSSQTKVKSNTTSRSRLPPGKTQALHGFGGMDKSRLQQQATESSLPLAASPRLEMSSTASRRTTKSIPKAPPKKVTSARPTLQGATSLLSSHRPRESRVSSGSSADLSDGSDHSRLSHRSTPKRQKRIAEDGVASPTPSDLHLTSLRLTPGSSSQRSHASSDNEEMIDAPPPKARKGRARLIDRLDAPRAQSVAEAEKLTAGFEDEVSQPSNTTVDDTAASEGVSQPPTVRQALERQSSNVSVAPSGRQRATYAKQRSHLSDMVGSLDSLPSSNSQPSSQQNYSQARSFTSAASQMEMDLDDSDEQDAFSQIKSIHELRRGGAVRQFDLDVQSILEDIESSKSLRITGLLQLASKLNEQTFVRHFQDSGNFQRLLECGRGTLDDVSATLIAMVLRCLILSESSSPKPLLQMLDVLYHLPQSLLLDTRPLSKLAKDRSQNISRAIIKDIAEFEETSAAMSSPPTRSVDKIILGSIESAQRKLISIKEPLPPLPETILKRVLNKFVKQRDSIEGRLTKQLEGVRLLLSVVEIACANRELSSSGLSPADFDDLGETVAAIMREASHAHPAIEHSCLRLIVSLSNNDTEVCGAFAEGNLIETVFQVVDDHFLTLAGLASLEKEFDHAQLESVILAVGCLLNLAECSDQARAKMLGGSTDEKSLVDRLVDIFNNHVDQTSEALTIDQTQILVAFGYISALLCTLCLNTVASKHISSRLKGDGLSQLFGAADTFLNHLRTVEAVLEEDGASSAGFTSRFTTVLNKVKRQA